MTEKTIIIRVEGGVIQSIEDIPLGIEIVVFDYDTDGATNGLDTDDNGEECYMATYSSNPAKEV